MERAPKRFLMGSMFITAGRLCSRFCSTPCETAALEGNLSATRLQFEVGRDRA